MNWKYFISRKWFGIELIPACLVSSGLLCLRPLIYLIKHPFVALIRLTEWSSNPTSCLWCLSPLACALRGVKAQRWVRARANTAAPGELCLLESEWCRRQGQGPRCKHWQVSHTDERRLFVQPVCTFRVTLQGKTAWQPLRAWQSGRDNNLETRLLC